MKIRMGFVSNSSSSSFVIHRSYLSKAQVDELAMLYAKCKDNDDIYDDNGIDFHISPNYVEFYGYGGDGMDKIWKLLKKFGVDGDKISRNN